MRITYSRSSSLHPLPTELSSLSLAFNRTIFTVAVSATEHWLWTGADALAPALQQVFPLRFYDWSGSHEFPYLRDYTP